MTTPQLVERLRKIRHGTMSLVNPDGPPAATLILAQAERLAAVEAERDAALRECSTYARQAGEAIGRLETSEAAGIVEGWKERALVAETARDAAEYRLISLGLHPKMDQDAAEICARLGTMYDHRGDGAPTQPCNPDGQDAVAVIERLNTELARARKALKEFKTLKWPLKETSTTTALITPALEPGK